MRRRLASLAAVFLGIMIGAARLAATEVAKTPIVFLAAVIQTGPFKITDGQSLEGIQFAVDEINAEGGIDGRPLALDVIDTELNASVTRRKAVDAVLSNHVAAIIGASGSDILNALVQVGQQYKVPVVAFAGENEELTGAQFKPALFRVASNTSMHAAAVVYALKQTYPEVKKVFLLNEDYSFGRAQAASFTAQLKRLDPGVEIVGNVFHPRGAADFTPYLQQVQASGAQFVLTGDWGADIVQLLNQSRSFGLKARIGGTFLLDPEILQGVGDAAIGDLGSDIYQPTIRSPANDKFVAAWHATHAKTDTPWPTATTGKSYIATQLAAFAIRKAGTTDFTALEKMLEGLHYASIAGPLIVRACDHQVQIGQAAGRIVPGAGQFYAFPFSGPVISVPADVLSVPPQSTGNPRCERQAE